MSTTLLSSYKRDQSVAGHTVRGDMGWDTHASQEGEPRTCSTNTFFQCDRPPLQGCAPFRTELKELLP